MRHSPSPDFPTCRRPFDTPNASVTRHSHGVASLDRENFGPNATSSKPFDLASAGNQLPTTKLLHCSGQRREREGNSCHGETINPEIWHTTGETTPEVDEAGIGSDRRGLRSVRRGVTPPHPGTPCGGPRADRPVPAPAVRIGGTLRQQALDELLNDLAEYRAASPAFRPYWRRLAIHDIARFRRDWLQPERAAFEAAVRARQARRAA